MTHFQKLLFVAGVTFKTGSCTRVFFCQFCEIFQKSFGCELLLLILHNTLLSLSIKFDFFATDFEKKNHSLELFVFTIIGKHVTRFC